MNLIIMGPPGGGKGTQAEGIVERHGVTHISTGDMLRAAVKSGSELGARVEKTLAAGELVGDELMMELIRDRLQQGDARERGWLLDGFPRTVPQAEGLIGLLDDLGQDVAAVISIEVPDEEIVRRLSGRLTCPDCGYVTHRDRGEAAAGDPCPRCGKGPLVQRADDREETVRNRLRVYREKTYPAAETLGRRYPLLRVDGTGRPSDVTQRIAGAVAEAEH